MTDGEKVFFTHYVEYIDDRLRRFFIKVLVMFTFLGLTCGVLGYFVAKTSKENTVGLCAIRKDAEQRIAQSKQFLKENPTGIPGISREQLERSTNNSVRTEKALSHLDCDPYSDELPKVTATP